MKREKEGYVIADVLIKIRKRINEPTDISFN